MRERGGALLTALVAIMVLLLISGVFFTFINQQFKMETSEEKGLKAYYLAEAGINYGVVAVRQNPSEYFAVPYLNQATKLSGMPLTGPFGTAYGGSFNVSVQTDDSNAKDYSVVVTSVGTYNGFQRTLREKYQFPK
ncbi:hypothetical protein CEB3_c45730 [Peptococcaceae bacterium CEB3]|nr:hypothetical protein CEB3_c45730 [Peptococcaceae bacterium CEB3]